MKPLLRTATTSSTNRSPSTPPEDSAPEPVEVAHRSVTDDFAPEGEQASTQTETKPGLKDVELQAVILRIRKQALPSAFSMHRSRMRKVEELLSATLESHSLTILQRQELGLDLVNLKKQYGEPLSQEDVRPLLQQVLKHPAQTEPKPSTEELENFIYRVLTWNGSDLRREFREDLLKLLPSEGLSRMQAIQIAIGLKGEVSKVLPLLVPHVADPQPKVPLNPRAFERVKAYVLSEPYSLRDNVESLQRLCGLSLAQLWDLLGEAAYKKGHGEAYWSEGTEIPFSALQKATDASADRTLTAKEFQAFVSAAQQFEALPAELETFFSACSQRFQLSPQQVAEAREGIQQRPAASNLTASLKYERLQQTWDKGLALLQSTKTDSPRSETPKQAFLSASEREALCQLYGPMNSIEKYMDVVDRWSKDRTFSAEDFHVLALTVPQGPHRFAFMERFFQPAFVEDQENTLSPLIFTQVRKELRDLLVEQSLNDDPLEDSVRYFRAVQRLTPVNADQLGAIQDLFREDPEEGLRFLTRASAA